MLRGVGQRSIEVDKGWYPSQTIDKKGKVSTALLYDTALEEGEREQNLRFNVKAISQIIDNFGRDGSFTGQSKCVLKERKKRNRGSDPRSEKRRLSRAIFHLMKANNLALLTDFLSPQKPFIFPCGFKAIALLTKFQGPIRTSPSIHFNIYEWTLFQWSTLNVCLSTLKFNSVSTEPIFHLFSSTSLRSI